MCLLVTFHYVPDRLRQGYVLGHKRTNIEGQYQHVLQEVYGMQPAHGNLRTVCPYDPYMAQNIHNTQHRAFENITYYNADLHHGHTRVQEHKIETTPKQFHPMDKAYTHTL